MTTTYTYTYTHTIHERGNGFPGVGSRIYDAEGNVLTVDALSCIHTAQWAANYVYAALTPTGESWDDVGEGEEDTLADTGYEVRIVTDETDDEIDE